MFTFKGSRINNKIIKKKRAKQAMNAHNYSLCQQGFIFVLKHICYSHSKSFKGLETEAKIGTSAKFSTSVRSQECLRRKKIFKIFESSFQTILEKVSKFSKKDFVSKFLIFGVFFDIRKC